MKQTTQDLLDYIKSNEHKYDVKLNNIRASIDKLDMSVHEATKKSEKYFYVLLGGLVSIGISFYYYGFIK